MNSKSATTKPFPTSQGNNQQAVGITGTLVMETTKRSSFAAALETERI